MSNYNIPELPLGYELETKAVLKQVNLAGRKLAELKGVARIWVENRLLGDISTRISTSCCCKRKREKIRKRCFARFRARTNIGFSLKIAIFVNTMIYFPKTSSMNNDKTNNDNR